MGTRSTFKIRWDAFSRDIVPSLQAVYGDRAESTIKKLKNILKEGLRNRSKDLRELDERRVLRPDWLQRPEQVGYVAYADLFANDLPGVAKHIPYLKSLGITYLHLMPLLKPRKGDSDGGYAVADYRRIRPDLGTMDDLAALTAKLRRAGISLETDLVLNHVAAEHDWAKRARRGEKRYLDYFMVYPDRTEPDAWEENLPEVFPDFAPGNFTHDEKLDAWVWTTFNSFQWDLNWANPEVFCEFVDLMVYLANQGVEVFRLDAIAFIWKRMGTDCQNQPEVHHITRALRAAVKVVAPAVAFKAEAIVGPNDLIHYLGRGIHHGRLSDLAYHNSLMVQIWSSLAARDTRLFTQALARFPEKPANTTWATYLRCHDDIGWAVDDLDAGMAGFDGPAHRRFLSDFYSGEFPGSFARGLVFQANPMTGDRRISGSCASLIGLETAIASGDPTQVDLAIARYLMAYTLVFGYGGLPLLYMGDELGLPNDHSYLNDPSHDRDNRWVHRPRMDWELVKQAQQDPTSPAGRINAGIRHLIEVRRRSVQLHASVESKALPCPDPRLLVLRRAHPEAELIEVYNFCEEPVALPTTGIVQYLGWSATELLSGQVYQLSPAEIVVRPYQSLWFVPVDRDRC